MKRLTFCAALVVASIGLVASFAGAATANSTGTITFESPTYTTGDINNQNGWMKTGTYDVAVVSLASFSDRSPGFTGDQALRLSNSVTSGSFGDQTFSPGRRSGWTVDVAPALRVEFPDRHHHKERRTARSVYVGQPGQRIRRADELPALRRPGKRHTRLL